MGKGEIARYEQFLLFPQCFQKACFPGVSKGVIVWEWVKEKYHSFRGCEIIKIAIMKQPKKKVLYETAKSMGTKWCKE